MDWPSRPRVEESAHSREAASFLALGERYAANPGFWAFFMFSPCLMPLAEVAHAGLYGFE